MMPKSLKQDFRTGWALGIILFISLLVHVASLLLGSTLLAGWHCVHHPVHAAIEIAGAIIAIVVARLLMILHGRGEGTSFNIAIAGALVGMGVLDGMHAFVHAGNAFVFLHSFASFMGGLLFSLVWLPNRCWTRGHIAWWPLAVLAAFLVVGVGSMTRPEWIPVMVRDGVFTPGAEFLNFAGGLLMFIAAVRMAFAYRTTRKVDDVLFCLHCGLFGAAAVMFEQSTLWDFTWWGWHVLRLLAYGVALWYIILSDERTLQLILKTIHGNNESCYRTLFESSRDALTILNGEEFLTGNPAALKLFGCGSVEQFSRLTPVDLSPPTQPCGRVSHDLASEYIARTLRDGSCSFEWRHRRADRSEFDAEVRLSLISNGPKVMLMAIVRDITERKETEKLVSAQNRILRLTSSVGTVLARESSMRLGLQSCCQSVVTELDAAFARIWTLDADGTTLELQASAGLYTHIDGGHARVPVGQFKIGRIAEHGEPHLTNDVINDPEIGDREWAIRENMAAFAGYPLIAGQRTVGVLALFANQPLTQEMLDGLGAISDTLAQFVERSRNARAMRMLKYSTDSANEAMFTINAEGRIVDVNQTACRRLEYSREELLAMSVPDINPRVSSRRWTEIWEEVRDRRELVFEAEHRTKSGRIIPVEVSKYFVEFENEPFICDSVREITDRKLAENALRESAEKTRAILNSTTDGIITITESGIIEEFNKAAERLFGYSAEELRGRNVSMLMPSPYRQEHDQYIARYLQTGERKIIGIGREVMGVRKDGTTFPLELGVTEVKHGEGRLFTGSVRDITERKEAARAIEESEARFQQLAQHLHDILSITTADGSEVIYVSPAYETIWGRSCKSLYLNPSEWADAIHPEDRERAAQAYNSHAAQEGYDEIFRVVRPDGTLRWVQANGFPIRNSAGEVFRIAGVTRDITARRQAELGQKKAELASLSKSQFLANMSHELRTPLNGVIGMTELLGGTNLTKKQQKYVDVCRNSGESLLNLINDILDFSKIEAGKLELDLHDFDLEKLVTDTVDTLAWRDRDKALEMPCYIDQMSRLVLKGDSNRLRQILVNLLGNAVKFTKEGEVVVRTKIVGRQDRQITVHFSISDTGIGIPSDKLDRLFQSFSQVDSSTTRNYGGTGLGLAISQSLVNLMGGEIGVESEVGVGSTFWFQVPFELVSESFEVIPETSPLAGRRALIVDDNETNRVILAEYTSAWGLHSVMATCVEEALAAVEESEVSGNPINMVLTDYNMPGRNGLDLARELKSHPQLIVLLLGSTDIHLSPSDLREHGIDATLRKPLRRHELHDVLCGLVDTAEEIEKHDGNESSASKETVMPSGHILLAEDNRINQLYMVELIKQLGCTCDTVVNGREATLAVQQGNYDLVLMDCQMPEMDGFEATRSIRQFETVAPIDRHLPIIALTANALKGDRERCLDAGMDDYLSKPVQKQQIIDLFERFFNNTNVPSLETGATVNGSEGVDGVSEVVPIDAESLMARCFGNVEFAESLLDELESTGVERLQEIQRYANEQNTVATADAAHALKGAAGILCAETVQKISAEIERRGRSSDVGDLESLVSDLASEMHRCLSSLPQLRKQLHLVKETI